MQTRLHVGRWRARLCGLIWATSACAQGVPHFVNSGSLTYYPAGDSSGLVMVGDFNNDGLPDALRGEVTLASPGNRIATVYLNTGNGDYQVRYITDSVTVGTLNRVVCVGDLNGDGVLDLVVARTWTTIPLSTAVYLGNGDGSFGRRPGDIGTAGSDWVYAGDLFDWNRDGDLDLVLLAQDAATGASHMTFWNNAGGGSFIEQTAARMVGISGNPIGVVVLDVDHDSDLDIFVANSVGAHELCTNDGTGHFSARQILGTGGNAAAAADGDLNGDGWEDIVVLDHAVPTILMNFQGQLSPASGYSWPAMGGLYNWVACLDFDHDGLDDIVSLTGNSLVALLRNNGSGFENRTIGSSIYCPPSGRPCVVDWDGDGDRDILAWGSFFASTIRQLANRVLPRIGQIYAIDVYGEVGHIDLLYMSLMRAMIRMGPIGWILIEPNSAVPIGLTYHQVAGVSTVTYGVPASAAVLGLVVNSQGLDVDTVSGSAHLMNRVIAVVGW